MKKNWWSITQQYWEANDKELNVDSDEFEKRLEARDKYKESLLGKIEDWWWYTVGYRIREFKQGIRNLINWFPIIWEDRDYSTSYIFKVLKQKLYFVSKYHIKKQHYVGWEREVERMILCIKLIDYVSNDHYDKIAQDYISDKYGKSEFSFTPVPDDEKHKDYSLMVIKHENIENGKYTQEEYDADYTKLMKEARDKHDKARTLLFKILSLHIEKWWI